MLIVEDLMLLLLDDKHGHIRGEGSLHYTLGGAVLMELALRGRVEIDAKKTVHAVDGEPLDDPLLQAAVEQAAIKPRYVQVSLIELGSTLRGTVLDRLVERGMIRVEKSRFLGIVPTTKMLPEAPAYEAALLERVRAVLEDGVTPDPRTATLVALLSASGTLPQFHPQIRWGNPVAGRARQFQNGDWGATAVDAAIMQIAVANAAVTVAVATGGHQSQ